MDLSTDQVQPRAEAGSELLIFVPRAAHRHDFPLSSKPTFAMCIENLYLGYGLASKVPALGPMAAGARRRTWPKRCDFSHGRKLAIRT